MRQRKQRLTESFLATDVVAVALAWIVAYYARFHSTVFTTLVPPYKGVPDFRDYAQLLPLLVILSAVVFALQGLYRLRRPLNAVDDALRVAGAFIVTAALLLGVTLYIRIYFRFAPEVAPRAEYSQGVFVLFVLFGIPLVILGRRLLLAHYERAWARGENAVRILVAGTSDLGQTVARKLAAHQRLGFNVVGFLTESGATGPFEGRPVLGSIAQANDVISAHSVDAVYVALSVERHAEMVDLVKNLNNEFVDVRIVPDLLQCLTLRAGIEDLDGIPIVSVNETPMNGPAAVAKRIMDITGALALLIGLTIIPVLPAIVVAIALKGGKGPIIYSQERMTVDGRSFPVYKFRTMVEDAEAATGPVWAVDGDPRRTELGAFLRKYNLDEWPQLLNIIKGDMSLVGPRPERPSFVAEFKNHIPNYMLRHRVRGGLTGWAQVHGWRGNSSLEKRIEFDLYYIENWSLTLDIKILVLTLFRGFGQTHAY